MQPAFAGSYKTIPSPKIPSEVGENGMSSGWICRWYKNTGEFVPFLWKVGENILEWVKLSIPPTSQMTMKNSPTHFCCFIWNNIIRPCLHLPQLTNDCTIRPCLHPPQLTNSPIKTVFFLYPHYFKTNHSRNSPMTLLSDRSIWGTTTSTQLSHIHIRHRCDMCEWVLSFIIHLLIHTFRSHFLPTVWGWSRLCYDQRCLCSTTRNFHPWFPFIPEINFHLFGRTNMSLQTKKVKTCTTNFLPLIFTHHFDWHAYLYTHKHPFKFTRLISPTYFHPRIFTHQFHLLFFTHLFSPSLFSPLPIPFIRCATAITHDSLRSTFTHLHILHTCRFHPLVDFKFL